MKKYKWILILVNLILLLWFFNNSIAKKEAILSNGQLVLLKLVPIDPRSLMQGDYMRLRYDISNNINFDKTSKRGYCVVKLDSKGIAFKVRLQENKFPKKDGEYLIEYTLGYNQINIGAESYFFEEGQSKKFASAKYGGLKIDNEGNSVLIGLFDDKYQLIK